MGTLYRTAPGQWRGDSREEAIMKTDGVARLPLALSVLTTRKPPMIQQAALNLSELYDLDETAWLEAMADLIQQGRCADLDYPHLQEYLTDMARRDRREVKSRLVVLIAHVLKWVHQPDQRSRSWRTTFVEQRQ